MRETVGQRVRRLRLSAGLSQRQLAEPGVSYPYISRIEAGTRTPSVKALRKIAPKLGVTAHYLETGDDVVTLHLDPEAARALHALVDQAPFLADVVVPQIEEQILVADTSS